MSKRYFWLKLKNNFFNQLVQKKMGKRPNGKELQIIYLRMLLCSLDEGGYIYFQQVFDSLEEELAEEFDEPVEIVKQTIDFLIANKMISMDDEGNCFLPEAVECTGSESDSAERMRRKRKNEKSSHCDRTVTESDGHAVTCDTDIDKSREDMRTDIRADGNAKDMSLRNPTTCFEKFWAAYPNKQRRGLAERSYCALTLSGDVDESDLLEAARNYAEYVRESGDKMYMPNNWLDKYAFEDYLPGNYARKHQGGAVQSGSVDTPEMETDQDCDSGELVGDDKEWWRYGPNAQKKPEVIS